MRKFTKEIAALLATAAVSASAGAATASSSEEPVRTAGVAINPDATAPVTTAYDRSKDEEPTFSEGTFEATTTTTASTYTVGTYVNTTTTTTAVEETPTEGTYVDRFTTIVGTQVAPPVTEDTLLIGDVIETTAYEGDETYHEGTTMYAVTTTTTYYDKWETDTYMEGTRVETTTTTYLQGTTTASTGDTWFAGGLMNESCGKGDANCDGKLSVADGVRILQYIANKDKYDMNTIQIDNADCYDPGSGLTAMDALTIQRVDAGVISQDDLPVYPESDN